MTDFGNLITIIVKVKESHSFLQGVGLLLSLSIIDVL